MHAGTIFLGHNFARFIQKMVKKVKVLPGARLLNDVPGILENKLLAWRGRPFHLVIE
jgi:hypothetical protein